MPLAQTLLSQPPSGMLGWPDPHVDQAHSRDQQSERNGFAASGEESTLVREPGNIPFHGCEKVGFHDDA
jgi:hypothetical protein